VIAHHTERIELKAIFLLTFLNCIKQQLPAFQSSQPKLAIVAANRDVITELGSELTTRTRHLEGLARGQLMTHIHFERR